MVDSSQPVRARGGMPTHPLRTAEQLISGGMTESSEIVRMARALEAARAENARLIRAVRSLDDHWIGDLIGAVCLFGTIILLVIFAGVLS